ncbi:MAG: hypothetical protein J7L58_07155 [Thermoplasmata archaeon]|nr:hypothetical protein [Thermoplasmata archaeon]
MKKLFIIAIIASILSSSFSISYSSSISYNLPEHFDLRNVNGTSYVTSVKHQSGGTCWCHGTMAALEGNLLITGKWKELGIKEEPNLAEYHLDWWNGFNKFYNGDLNPPTGNGLDVHYGGDYRVASAYLTREGAVYCEEANDETEYDYNWFEEAPEHYSDKYIRFYPRHIEWYVAGDDLGNIDLIKRKLMENGVVATCMCYSGSFIDARNFTHYQPPTDDTPPNHAIAIVGWDDNKKTQAPKPGAWLCKNSWGSDWGIDGYFWISYYDKWCGKHPEMGAVSFQQVEPMKYDFIYYHDYHGWRDTLKNCNEAFNAFVASSDFLLQSVSFYTAADSVEYIVRIYDRFENGKLQDLLVEQSGIINYTGYHTIDLEKPVAFPEGDDFYIYLSLSHGGHPIDCTSEVPVLLGSLLRGTIVKSTAHFGESYMKFGNRWVDLHFINPSANFCIKGLGISFTPTKPDLECNGSIKLRDIKPGSRVKTSFIVKNAGEPLSNLDWEIVEWPEWGKWEFSPSSMENLKAESKGIEVEVSVVVPKEENATFEGTIKVINKDNSSDYEIIPVVISTSKKIMLPMIFIQKICEELPFLKFLVSILT